MQWDIRDGGFCTEGWTRPGACLGTVPENVRLSEEHVPHLSPPHGLHLRLQRPRQDRAEGVPCQTNLAKEPPPVATTHVIAPICDCAPGKQPAALRADGLSLQLRPPPLVAPHGVPCSSSSPGIATRHPMICVGNTLNKLVPGSQVPTMCPFNCAPTSQALRHHE